VTRLAVEDPQDRHQVGVALYHRLWAINAAEGPDPDGDRAQTCERIVRLLCELYDTEPDRIDRTGGEDRVRLLRSGGL
jgi:hypothetical protein